MRNTPCIDLHCDTVMELLAGAGLYDRDIQVNLPGLKQAAMCAQVFACYIPPSIPTGACEPLAHRMLDVLYRNIENMPEELALCTRYEHIREMCDGRRVGVVLAIENGSAIENDVRKLAGFYNRGVRCMTIVHAKSHDWAISSNDDEPAFDGLTSFGEEVIAAMNEIGMIVDLSHSHDRTVERVLSITRRPVVASHSGVHQLCPIDRNLRDEWIQGIAESGGIIGINFYNGFLDADYANQSAEVIGNIFSELSQMEKQAGNDIVKITHLFHEARDRYLKSLGSYIIPVERVLDHVDYVIELVGDDYVGFGSDFDGMPHAPAGLEDCSGFRLLKQKMMERGYSSQRIEKICYKNFLRVMKAHVM